MIRLVAKGKAAHASMPELGENAIERMVEALGHALRTPFPRTPFWARARWPPCS